MPSSVMNSGPLKQAALNGWGFRGWVPRFERLGLCPACCWRIQSNSRGLRVISDSGMGATLFEAHYLSLHPLDPLENVLELATSILKLILDLSGSIPHIITHRTLFPPRHHFPDDGLSGSRAARVECLGRLGSRVFGVWSTRVGVHLDDLQLSPHPLKLGPQPFLPKLLPLILPLPPLAYLLLETVNLFQQPWFASCPTFRLAPAPTRRGGLESPRPGA